MHFEFMFILKWTSITSLENHYHLLEAEGEPQILMQWKGNISNFWLDSVRWPGDQNGACFILVGEKLTSVRGM